MTTASLSERSADEESAYHPIEVVKGVTNEDVLREYGIVIRG
jgi:hypothetical protein